MDEGFNDCLVGTCGCESIHSGKVWPHKGGPETDGQVLTGHQVHPVQLAHPGKENRTIYSFSAYSAQKTQRCLPQKTNKYMKEIYTLT